MRDCVTVVFMLTSEHMLSLGYKRKTVVT